MGKYGVMSKSENNLAESNPQIKNIFTHLFVAQVGGLMKKLVIENIAGLSF